MIELPWPPRGLSPNAREHWSAKSAGLKAPDSDKILLVLEFVPNDKRSRDDDNLLASFKAGRDGLADALGIDDSRFVTQFRMSEEIIKGGVVRVSLQEYRG